ncbi:hypothetical immediate-early protein [Lymphocystis disease virus 1]|uniref:hypothetical immediate-early protein n=1 Tax=Fish lymphocystis disease virus TaxID=36363 RepID=UPI0000161EB7|nr:hypothetical immediate-early protein [Lymphocystis disease virus 1]
MDSHSFKTTQKFYSPAYYNKIGYKHIDSQADLRLFCAPKTSENKELRGVVYKKDKLVFASLPYNKQTNDIPTEFESTGKFFSLTEGTVVNMFYINNQWFIAGNKNFNIFNLKWASKTTTFGDTAFEAILHLWKEIKRPTETKLHYIQRFALRHLNPKYGYIFLLSCTVEEKLVCHSPKIPYIKLLALYHKGIHTFEHFIKVDNGLIIRTAKALKFNTTVQLECYLEGCDPYEIPGVLYIDPKKGHLKIYTAGYSTLLAIRGNNPNVKETYISFFLSRDEFAQDCLINIHPYLKSLNQTIIAHLERIALCYIDLVESADWKPQYWMSSMLLNFVKDLNLKTSKPLTDVVNFLLMLQPDNFIWLTKTHMHLASKVL